MMIMRIYATSAFCIKRSTSVLARLPERLIDSMPAADGERRVITLIDCFRFRCQAH